MFQSKHFCRQNDFKLIKLKGEQYTFNRIFQDQLRHNRRYLDYNLEKFKSKSTLVMLSSHIRDFLEDFLEESYYDNELSLKSVRQKNPARPQQYVNQMLSRS